MEAKFKELETAKENVRYLVDHTRSLVDMHGLAYWAGVVERLVSEITQAV